jgi:hypothetical protein
LNLKNGLFIAALLASGGARSGLGVFASLKTNRS